MSRLISKIIQIYGYCVSELELFQCILASKEKTIYGVVTNMLGDIGWDKLLDYLKNIEESINDDQDEDGDDADDDED